MVALKLKLPYLAIIKISRDRLLNEENVVRQVFGFGAVWSSVEQENQSEADMAAKKTSFSYLQVGTKYNPQQKKEFVATKKIGDRKYNCWASTLMSRLQLLKSHLQPLDGNDWGNDIERYFFIERLKD